MTATRSAAWRTATCLGLGTLRPAPGTLASLAAVPAGLGLVLLGGEVLLVAGVVLTLAVGWWAAERHREETGTVDAPEVVIDEVAGQWIALLGTGGRIDLALVAFALFRLFDILKPFPIGWIDTRMRNGFGTMLDDALAGGLALLGTLLAGTLLDG